MNNIKITLETLYDILRNEKKKEDLQKLDNSFFVDVISYLKEKKSLLKDNPKTDELFAAGEKEKVEYELRSIKRILKELYERREKKIIDIAINKSRTGSDIIDTEAMLKEEKEFYKNILETLDSYRRGILLNLFRMELPKTSTIKSFEEKKEEKKEELKAELKAELEIKTAEKFREKLAANNPPVEDSEEEPKEPAEEVKKIAEPEQKLMKKIRFKHPVPSFVWKDMKVYGPFDEGDTTEIFQEVAELLIRKGRAEDV